MYKALNSKQRDVMMQCLLLANHDENEWEWGAEIYRCRSGQFITSLESLSRKCASDVKVQSVRTSLLKLEKWGFLTNESTKTGRLITICKWETYQSEILDTNKGTNKGLTKSQQRANKELTTNKNVKNDKNDKESIYPFSEFWNDYAKKVGKPKSQAKYQKIGEDDRAIIRGHVPRYVASTPDPKYRKDPTTYLNGEHWHDEIISGNHKPVNLDELIDHRIYS